MDVSWFSDSSSTLHDVEIEPTELKKPIDDITHHEDHPESRLQVIRKNPLTFAWCLFTVWTIIVASYEDQSSSSVLAIPEFRKDFGSYYNGDYVLAASWQSAFQGGPVATYVLFLRTMLRPQLANL